jgi:thiol-disulfide isomerase/thioredoxin
MKAWPLLILLALSACGPPVAAAEPAQAATPPGEVLAQAAGASLIGKYAPPLTLRTVDGKTIDLAQLYGKRPVYLKFWATWCVPCRLQMPHFENVERTKGRDIEVVAVDVDFNESRDAVLRYRETMGLTMPIVIDDGRLADALHLRVTPQHVVVGRDGRILHVGNLADARLDRSLDQAIAEPSASGPGAGDQAPSPRPRAAAPALKTLSGEPMPLGDGRRPTVIFFFSPWCESYFKTSRPAMSQACHDARVEVSRLSGQSGVRWLGVAAGLWATDKAIADYQRANPLPMPLAFDETGGFFRAFKVADVPSFVVLDPAGKIVARTRQAQQAVRAASRAGATSKETL